MMIKTATFAAACLMTIASLPVANAQTADTSGYPPAPPPTYGTAPGAGGTQVLTNGPQTNPGDVSPSWSARRNVAESARYDRLLETNGAFRQARMRKECGPVTDPDLHAQCIASFSQYEPATTSAATPSRIASSTMSGRHHYTGSSTAPRHYQSRYGQ